ncbi:MAG: NADH-quinone oxidoreductase subunit N, partial [Bacillota bacterium]
MDYLYILPELIIVAVALVLLVGAAVSPKDRQGYMPVVTALGFLAALVAIYPALGQDTSIFGRMITVDGFAQFFKVIFLIVGVLITLASAGYMRQQRTSGGEYYVLLMFAVTGMIFMASSTDLLAIWLGLELVSIASYVLAGYRREDPKSNEAAIKYFLMGAIASAVLLFGLSLIYGFTGTTNLVDIARIDPSLLAANPAGLGVALFMLVAGFGFKVAMVPFHMWAPDAYEGAPTPVTAFFSIGPKAAGLAALIRIFPVGLAALTTKWSLLFAVIAAVSMTVGNLTALSQKNIKRMMAYSSIAQVGYITIGLAVATAASIQAIMFYVLAYVFINAGLFSMIIILDER